VRRRRACLRRARAHNRTCHPNPAAVTCAGRCGVWPNNCGHPTRCPACPAGRTCTANGSCAEPCTDGSCPSGCGCSIENWEGTRACVPFIFECPTQPCEGTAECPPGSQCQVCTTGGPSVCFPLCPS
jgi:hypothetical protein